MLVSHVSYFQYMSYCITYLLPYNKCFFLNLLRVIPFVTRMEVDYVYT
jgi:acyl-CoA thioesterase FadM